MSGAFFVAGVICCCVGHPWIGGLLIWVALQMWGNAAQNRPDKTYYRS